jgi:PhnB protein
MPDVQPIPDTYPRLTPHLSVKGANEAIAYYGRLFGARERMRIEAQGGQIAHAEIVIGGSVIMIGDEVPGGVDPSPATLGGSPVALWLYVEDVDGVFEHALGSGSRAVAAPADQFYGDRVAMFDDPFGHRWNIATHIEDMPPDEMRQRAAALAAGAGS